MSPSEIPMDAFARLLDLPLGVAQAENAAAMDVLNSVLPLQVHEYDSGREHNGWVVPADWRVRRAVICQDGEVLFDATMHPLALAGYSASFNGTVTKEELDRHVFYRESMPGAYVFHSVFNYRPWERHWGFCIPYALYRTWNDGLYEVDIDVSFDRGRMLVGEHLHEGRSRETIVFQAHTCHPGQANDDLAGVMVILALFRWLQTQETHYSYLALFAPEHLGTVFYLADHGELARFKLGCFVEMVGTSGPLVLQESFTGRAAIDRVAKHVLSARDRALKVGPFRSVVGNDETVWEAPGIEVPMISVTRWPYQEYHTSEDDLAIMSEVSLSETVEALKEMISVLEHDSVVERLFTGLPALSNPKYDLYVERWDPTVDKQLSDQQVLLGSIQDRVLRYLDGSRSVFEIAELLEVPFPLLSSYLAPFEPKGLVRFSKPESLDFYDSTT